VRTMWTTLTYRGPSLAALQHDYAKNRRIDDAAPIRGRAEVVVAASAERVWQILADVAAWGSTLEPGVRGIRLDHGVTVDAEFVRSNKGARMRARFAVVDPGRELAWTGAAFGTRVVHCYILEPTSAHSTRVIVEESMSGALLAFLFSTAKLNALLQGSLSALKSAAEAEHDFG
jgi:hypothetical protein